MFVWRLSTLLCALLLSFSFLGVGPAAAQNRCTLTPPVDALITLLQLQLQSGGGLTDDFRGEIARVYNQINRNDVVAILAASRAQDLMVHIDGLIGDTSYLVRTDQFSDPAITRARLTALENEVTSFCHADRSDTTTVIYDPINRSNNERNDRPVGDRPEPTSGGERLGQVQSYLSSAGLAIGALMTAGLMLGLRQLWLTITAFHLHRSKCKIDASLWIGGETIVGEIIVLGRRGARFQPFDSEDPEYARAHSMDQDAFIAAGDIHVPCCPFRVAKGSVGVYFEVPLRIREVRRLLSLSKLVVSTLPDTPKAANVPVRKVENARAWSPASEWEEKVEVEPDTQQAA